MLIHFAEVVLQDLQLLLSGNHWLFHGHLLLGQDYGARHCGEGLVSLLKLGVATSGATLAEPQICNPCPHQPPSPPPRRGLWLRQGSTPFPKTCQGAQLGAPAPQQLLSQFPQCSDHTPAVPSAELPHHPQLAGSCRLLSAPLLLYL